MASPPTSSVETLDAQDSKHGFSRPEMYKESLTGTVQLYEKHVFLCYKEPQNWPSHVENSDEHPFPRALAAAIKARKNDMPKKTRLTICGGGDELDGDVLIFPNMICYKGLTSADVENFVEEVLVQEQEWSSKMAEKLGGSHVFVCAHASRDMRCGYCGPALIEKFKEEISSRDSNGHVFVRPCSHVGGHKYAGNVLIYSPDAHGEIAGHWYGYVTLDDVAVLLDDHVGKAKIVDKLWRGQMGLDEEQQRTKGLERCGCFCKQETDANGSVDAKKAAPGACCQEKVDKKTSHCGGICGAWSQFSSYFDGWERGDTLAALAVIGAAAAVAVAFNYYRKPS